MRASLIRPRQPAARARRQSAVATTLAALAFAGSMVAQRRRRWGRRGGVLVAGGLILWLGSSCALWSGKRHQDPSSTKAAPTPAPAAAGGANHGADTAAGRTAGRSVTSTSAHVASDDATEAPSPGRDLLAQALAGAGAAPAEARAGTGEGDGTPAAAAERRVGVVRVIGAHGKFVLIEATNGSGGGPLAEGQELRCRGPVASGGAQTAVLQVARERQEPFLVADVLSGEPQAGDIAYLALEKKSENARRR